MLNKPQGQQSFVRQLYVLPKPLKQSKAPKTNYSSWTKDYFIFCSLVKDFY